MVFRRVGIAKQIVAASASLMHTSTVAYHRYISDENPDMSTIILRKAGRGHDYPSICTGRRARQVAISVTGQEEIGSRPEKVGRSPMSFHVMLMILCFTQYRERQQS